MVYLHSILVYYTLFVAAAFRNYCAGKRVHCNGLTRVLCTYVYRCCTIFMATAADDVYQCNSSIYIIIVYLPTYITLSKPLNSTYLYCPMTNLQYYYYYYYYRYYNTYWLLLINSTCTMRILYFIIFSRFFCHTMFHGHYLFMQAP